MDRQIVYPGQIPLETDLLNSNKFAMVAVAKLAAAMLGTSTIVNGLACVPTGPASLQVVVNPGEMYTLVATDATPYSSLAADAHNILKQGISLDPVLLTCTPPVTAGQSINYLIQAAYQDSDTGLVTLPYYNASNPSQAYSGPNNSGVQQATARKGIVLITAKAGTAATTGSQTTPAPDAGYTGLWVVTVANSQTTITAGNIVQASGAPFIVERLGDKISATTGDVRYAPTGVVGSMRNARMSVAAASASATFTADEIVVEETLGGRTYRLGNFNKTINLGTTGVGGMDAGTAPTSGYVALYAIYNPTTGASALLATNATSAVQPEVYGGANMPAGYTASALVSVWPTNGSGQLVVGFQRDRHVSLASVVVGTYTTAQTNAPVTLPVPKNAVVVTLGVTQTTASAATNLQFSAAASSPVVGGLTTINAVISGSGLVGFSQSGEAWILTPQTIYITWVVNGGTSPTLNLSASGYSF